MLYLKHLSLWFIAIQLKTLSDQLFTVKIFMKHLVSLKQIWK
jgi:hypothetical protein